MAGEARCQPGLSKASETGPMMGVLRVALRTLSVECRLLRVSYPRSCSHQSPYRRYCGQRYIRAGQRPGARKWVPGQGRAAERGGGWSPRSSPRTVSAPFCGADHRARRTEVFKVFFQDQVGVNSASCGAVLRRDRARAVLTRKPGHLPRAPLHLALALVFCVQSMEVTKNFSDFPREGELGS